MNYLAHQYVARRIRRESDAPALFFAGNILPDILAMSGDGRLRSAGEHTGPLADGIRLHLSTDRRFHTLPAFHEAQAQANRLLLSALWVVPPHRRFFLAHVMTELALDAAILATEPALPDDLYGSLAAALRDGLVPLTETISGKSAPNLRTTAERFIESRYLHGYSSAEGLASSLIRACKRAAVPLCEDPRDVAELARVFTELSLFIVPRTADLLRISVADAG